MAKLKYNVGAFPGNAGTGVLYLGVADNGKEFFYTLHDHDGDANTAPRPAFISRSSVVNMLTANTAGLQVARVVNYSNLLETEPSGLADANGLIAITNAPATAGTTGYPRTWAAGVAMFSIKGSDVTTTPTDTNIVTTATVNDWVAGITPGTTLEKTDTNGDGVIDEKDQTPTPAATGFTAQLAEFAKENPYTIIGLAIAITILIVLLIQYFNKSKGGRRRRR